MLANHTNIGFILLGFGGFREIQVLLFLIFLIIYAVTITGNMIIVTLVVIDQNLHTPMYFFLGNLSFLEACYSSNIFPQMLLALLTGDRRIYFTSCFAQLFLCSSFVAVECCLLCVMSYDRCLAICKPLHYSTIMNAQTCIQLAVVLWVSGFAVCSILLTLMLHKLTFCGYNEINHYFCEYLPLLKLSCNNTSLLELMGFILILIFTLPPFLLILTSYLYIIIAILKIPSATGKQRAFSTCSSHLVSVSIFYGSLMIVYLLPKNQAKKSIETLPSLLYVALPPFVNPFIYSLRNKEVKEAVRYNIGRLFPIKKTPASY
uniref:Olfactory receptor n=1 Tax=Salvator merianae TaxID=96440 RepID=A0A8D0E515_SALMN